MTRLLLALLLVAAATPAPAADTLAVVAVADPPAGPDADLAELTHELRAACRDRTGGVLDVPEMRARLRRDTAGTTLPELERAFAATEAVLRREDFDGAARTLRGLAEDLQNLPESAEGWALYVRASVRLAFAERLAGRAAASAAVLQRLATLDTGFPVDEAQYPPSFRRACDEARRAAAAQPKAKLLVRTGEHRALAFVEGRPVGRAPASLALPPGRYRVGAVELGPAEVRALPASVQLEGADREVNLDLTLPGALRLDAGPGLAIAVAQRPAELIGAGAWLGVNRLVAASVVSDGDARFLEGALYDVAKGSLVRAGKVRMAGGGVPPAQLGALAAFLLTGQPGHGVAPTDPIAAATEAAQRAAAARAALGGPPLATAAVPQRRAWLKPSAYAAGAVALGLAGVATWQGLTAHSRYQDADAMLLPDGVFKPGFTQQQRNDKLAQGDSAKRNAYLAGGGALVFAATAGVLGWLSWDESGQPVARF